MKKMWVPVLLLLVASRLFASTPTTNERDMRAELADMNTTLKEIARLFKEQATLQKSDLLMKRVTLASSELSSAQDRLKRVDQELGAKKDEQAEFETLLSKVEGEIATSDEARSAR